MAHLKELEGALAPYFAERTSQDWLARFDALDVLAGPAYDVLEMKAAPQVAAREMVVEVGTPPSARSRRWASRSSSPTRRARY